MRRRMHDIIPGILSDFRPDICLYDAGVDPHKDDELGRLSLTTQGLLRRDTMVRLPGTCASALRGNCPRSAQIRSAAYRVQCSAMNTHPATCVSRSVFEGCTCSALDQVYHHLSERRLPHVQVLEACWKAGIPVAGYVGGGYHTDLQTLALWHSTLHRAAEACWHNL